MSFFRLDFAFHFSSCWITRCCCYFHRGTVMSVKAPQDCSTDNIIRLHHALIFRKRISVQHESDCSASTKSRHSFFIFHNLDRDDSSIILALLLLWLPSSDHKLFITTSSSSSSSSSSLNDDLMVILALPPLPPRDRALELCPARRTTHPRI